MYIHTKYIYIYTHHLHNNFQTFPNIQCLKVFPPNLSAQIWGNFQPKKWNPYRPSIQNLSWAEQDPTLSLQDRSTSQWYYTCRKRQGDSGPFFRRALESVTSLSLVCLMMVVVVVLVVVFFLGGEEDFDKKTKSYIVAVVGLWFCDLWFFVTVEYVWGGQWI